MEIKFSYPTFIKEALFCDVKYSTIRAGRRTGKTYNAVQWLLETLLTTSARSALWVDTKHTNIDKYVRRYFFPMLKPIARYVTWDQQKKILILPNNKYIDFGSAERRENLEGFGYDLGVLNEAGIILKKPDLWENTLMPMFKGDSKVRFIGTTKGHNYFEKLTKIEDPYWRHFHFTAYDSPYWDKNELDRIRDTISPFRWKQEYMADFIEGSEEALLQFEHLMFYENTNIAEFDKLYIHADTTHTGKDTSDYFCLVVLGENLKDKKFYVIDFILKKMDVESQAKASILMYKKYGKLVKKFTYDEKANQGFGFWIKKLAREDYKISLPITELKYSQDKFQHFEPHVPHFISQRVVLPSKHPNIEEAQRQLLAFPDKDVHDDFIDGMSGVLDNFNTNGFYFSIS